MPRTSAISCVVAPWKPRSAKIRATASMISGARRRGVGFLRDFSETTDMSHAPEKVTTDYCFWHALTANSIYRVIEIGRAAGILEARGNHEPAPERTKPASAYGF